MSGHAGDRFLCVDRDGHAWRNSGHHAGDPARPIDTCDRCSLVVEAPLVTSVASGPCRGCAEPTIAVPDWQGQVACTTCRQLEQRAWWPDCEDDPYRREDCP